MEIFNATNLVYILGGFIKTIEISVLSIICSVVVGTVLALVKSYGPRPFRWLVSAYIELFRCTPNLLWILFIYFTVQGVDIFISTLAFTLFTSAVMAEIVRAGLNAVPAGQFEAAQSQGFGFFATMRYIILPQTFKIILPPLCNQALNLVKNSAVLALIAGGDLMYNADNFVSTYGYLQGYILCCFMYFIICFPLAILVQYLERRSKRRPRAKVIPGVTPEPAKEA